MRVTITAVATAVTMSVTIKEIPAAASAESADSVKRKSGRFKPLKVTDQRNVECCHRILTYTCVHMDLCTDCVVYTHET